MDWRTQGEIIKGRLMRLASEEPCNREFEAAMRTFVTTKDRGPLDRYLCSHSGSGRDRDTTDGYTHMLPEDVESQRAVQEIADFYMPAEIEPLARAMKLKPTAYKRWAPEKRRAYHREYMRKRRAAARAGADT